ncbi:hypothetical protein NT239_16020 [Chitinibacter sp. SCUT-21]|uniref:hypothetical protein n=1 Tax=Chitinibacter sp. SCUT-21 TaxID=2970891 RepID=UPI0035A651C5
MPNQAREQKKQHLVYASQLHRLQLETKLLESRRPIKLASSFMGGAASWGVLTTLALKMGKSYPAVGRLVRGLKLFSVVFTVARMMRNK